MRRSKWVGGGISFSFKNSGLQSRISAQLAFAISGPSFRLVTSSVSFPSVRLDYLLISPEDKVAQILCVRASENHLKITNKWRSPAVLLTITMTRSDWLSYCCPA